MVAAAMADVDECVAKHFKSGKAALRLSDALDTLPKREQRRALQKIVADESLSEALEENHYVTPDFFKRLHWSSRLEQASNTSTSTSTSTTTNTSSATTTTPATSPTTAAPGGGATSPPAGGATPPHRRHRNYPPFQGSIIPATLQQSPVEVQDCLGITNLCVLPTIAADPYCLFGISACQRLLFTDSDCHLDRQMCDVIRDNIEQVLIAKAFAPAPPAPPAPAPAPAPASPTLRANRWKYY